MARPSQLVWRRDGLYLVVIATYFATSVAVELSGLIPGAFVRIIPTDIYFWSAPLVLGTSLVYVGWRLLGPRRVGDRWRIGVAGFRALRVEQQRAILDDPRPLRALILGLVTPLLLNTYGAWKTLIPYLNPFRYDVTFAELDRTLHAGVDPWRLIHPLLATPVAARVLDTSYLAWLFLIPAVVLWQAWSARDDVRPRFFLSFGLTWCLLGTAAATFLSSAGPCYFEQVTGDAGPYGGLFEYLRTTNETGAPLRALAVQDFLWQSHLLGDAHPFARISAMPSLHVAIATLYVFAARAINPWLGIAFGIYALLILLGSVHLGWHYAVDGYAGILGATAIWWLAGRVLEGGRG